MPVAVLALGLSGCVALAWSAYRERDEADKEAFTRLVTNAETDVRQRFNTYVEALNGGAGFLRASNRVDRSEWREFAATLSIDERYPGIRGIGVIFPVGRAELDSFVADVRAGGAPEFSVHGAGHAYPPASQLAVITYIEPFQRNSSELGLDINSEPRRRYAAREACDFAEPRFTERLEFSPDGQNQVSGSLLFVPVYRRGSIPGSVEERRTALMAWVYAPFVYEELFRGAIGRREGIVELHLFEGARTAPEKLLYRSKSAQPNKPFERIDQIELGGRTFTLAWSRGERFVAAALPPRVWTALSASLAAILLAGLVWSVQGTSRRARALADELTREMADAQRELQVSQTLLKTVTGRLPGMIAYWTADLRCAFSNTEYLEWFGRTPEQMKGMTMPDVLGEELFKKNEPYIRGVLNGTPQRFERQLTKQNGEVCHTWAQYIPHFGPDGSKVIGFVVLVSDVTEVMRQQDALRASEARLRTSLKDVTDLKKALDAHAIVAVTDAKGVITYANDRFCEISRFAREELIGQTHRLVSSNTHPPEFFATLWDTISSGRIWRGVICNRKKGGGLYWVETTIMPFLGEDGRPVQYIAIRTDITGRVELERSLAVARDQALEASRLKSEFLATMSHEIRTPMNAIIGMTGLLSDTPLKPEQSEMVRIVTSAAESLLTIINDILDFSRIEAGQLRLDQKEFDFASVTREVVSLFAPPAQAKRIGLKLDFESPPACRLVGDAGRVRQVLINLVGNAVKFTETGGVTVKVRKVDDSEEGVRMRVDVADTGIGIPSDARERLFHPFVQVDGSPTRRFGGTGLGLAITHQLLTAMGGEIGYESELGRGSTFSFEIEFKRGGALARELGNPPPKVHDAARALLPRRPAGNGAAQTPAAAAPEQAVGALKLLLVEDNAANQQVALRMLTKLGHSVDAVCNGHLALERLAAGRYDAVLMDCQMPLLDGYETTQWIRSGRLPGVDSDVPVIALTAYAREEDRSKCIEAGMDAYVSKPIRMDELKAAVDGIARNVPVDRIPARKPENVVLDAEVLDTARALPGTRGPSLLPELIQMYLALETPHLARIQKLIAERSPTAAHELHGFGGNAASFGGAEVRHVAIEIEQVVRRGEWHEADRRVEELQQACQRLRAAVREFGGAK